MRPVAVLSTTVLPLDGVYSVQTLAAGNIPDLAGVPHYIGHPDTKVIVESLGAVQAPSKLFAGLQPGDPTYQVYEDHADAPIIRVTLEENGEGEYIMSAMAL